MLRYETKFQLSSQAVFLVCWLAVVVSAFYILKKKKKEAWGIARSICNNWKYTENWIFCLHTVFCFIGDSWFVIPVTKVWYRGCDLFLGLLKVLEFFLKVLLAALIAACECSAGCFCQVLFNCWKTEPNCKSIHKGIRIRVHVMLCRMLINELRLLN